MVDNPRSFIIIILAAILGLSAVLYATRTYLAEVEKNSTLLISISNGLPKQPSKTVTTPTTTAKKTTTSTTNNEGALGTHIVTPKTRADYVVSYTTSGFSPQKLTVKSGEVVRFLNQNSGRSLWITAVSAPANFSLSEFNSGKSIGNNGTYDYTFNKKGSYVYYNLNFRNDVGLITVQ